MGKDDPTLFVGFWVVCGIAILWASAKGGDFDSGLKLALGMFGVAALGWLLGRKRH